VARKTPFPNDEAYDELVIVRDIPFQSLCMHHLLPFHGVAHVGVVLKAEHLCMSLRGVQTAGARTVTSALLGLVRDDPRTREEFLSLTGGRR
jgi:GTP cyclohydrolase I